MSTDYIGCARNTLSVAKHYLSLYNNSQKESDLYFAASYIHETVKYKLYAEVSPYCKSHKITDYNIIELFLKARNHSIRVPFSQEDIETMFLKWYCPWCVMCTILKSDVEEKYKIMEDWLR